MKTKLKNLVITKVALVDEGSCSAAHIKLYKRKGGQAVMFDEILKSLSAEEQATVQAEIKKQADEAAAAAKKAAEDAAKVAADKAAADATVEKKKLEDEIAKLKTPAAQSEEEILKNANLDPAIKAILETNIAKAKAAEAVVKALKDKEEEATFLAKASEVKGLPVKPEELVSLLKSIKGVDGAVDKVTEILKSASALITKGGAFKEVGSNADGSSDDEAKAWAAIEKAADELVVKSKGLSRAQAIQKAIEANPELYVQYLATQE